MSSLARFAFTASFATLCLLGICYFASAAISNVSVALTVTANR